MNTTHTDVSRYEAKHLPLRAVVFCEHYGDHSAFVVIGLEYDIAAQGRTREEAIERFEATLIAEEEVCKEVGKTWPQDIPASPQWFHDMWDRCT